MRKDRRREFTHPFYLTILLLFLALLLPHIKGAFHNAGSRWLYLFFFSFSLSYCLVPVIRRISKKYGILDTPDERKIHTVSTPLLGGVAILMSFLIVVIFSGFFAKEVEVIVLTLSAFLVFLSGLWDDVRGLSAPFRLIVQTVAALLLVSSGVSVVIFEPVGFGLIINILITLFWIVGITNAMNFFDGMDGLASGLSAVIATFMGVVAFQTNQPLLGWLYPQSRRGLSIY